MLWGLENLTWGNIDGAFTTGQLTLTMATGHTARFTQFPARAVIWNAQSYASPDLAFWDGFAEIVTLVSKAGDTFDAILRGQEGTVAISSDGSEVYRIAVVLTRQQLDKMMRAPPDASGPFDAILSGTPATVTNAISREVDGSDADHFKSIQGSPNVGRSTGLYLGDTTDPTNFLVNLLKVAGGVDDRLTMALNALPFLTFEGRDRMGIRKAAPGFDGGIDFGAPVGFDKLFGIGEVQHEIAAGAITGVETNFVRIATEGGSGPDELASITLAPGFAPPGARVILFLEPGPTSNIVVKHNLGSGGIKLNGDVDFRMNGGANRVLAIISTNASNDNWQELFRFPRIDGVVIARDLKTLNTPGGTFTSGAWQTRDLNTLEQSDTLTPLATLAANQLALQPGIWKFFATAPAANGITRHQLRLRNITAGTTAILGTSEAQGGSTQTRAFLYGRIQTFGVTTFELQHRCLTTVATSGFGLAANFDEQEQYSFLVAQRES